MPLILQYFIKLSLTLTVFYLFYYAVLKNLTFHTWNRFYLLGYSLMALVVPFINITPWIQQQSTSDDYILYKVILSSRLDQLPASSARSLFPVSVWPMIMVLLAAGSMVMIVRFLLQLIAIRRLKRSATLIKSSQVNLYDVDSAISPFSFAQAIFINSKMHSEADLQKIIGHEFVHVRQRHTIDLLIGELLCIVNWYNPFAWLIKKAIRQNLEFIADQGVLQTGVDARDYQYLLLKVTGLHQFSVSNNFTLSSLKKRIVMMNRMKSARVHLAKFLFVLPLLAVVLVAFGQQQKKPHARLPSRQGVGTADTVPPPPPPPITAQPAAPPLPPAVVKPSMAPPLPEGVSRITPINNGITVNLKSGHKEVYDLDVPADKAAYEKKYGKLPPPAPPASKKVFTKVRYTAAGGIAVDTVMPVIYQVDDRKVSMQLGDSLKITADTIYYAQDAAIDKQKYYSTDKNLYYSSDLNAWKQIGPGKKEDIYNHFNGVLIVDGKTVPADRLSGIDPSSIESIEVLKRGQADIILYGEKAREGVIILHIKKNRRIQ